MARIFRRGFSCVLRSSVLALTLAGLAACATPEERAQQYLKNGQDLLAKGDLAKAGTELGNAIRLKKDLIAAWRGLGEIQERSQNWAALATILRTIVEYDPNDSEAKLKLGRLMLAGGAAKEALPLISPISDRDDAPANAVALKAALLLTTQDAEGAVREARRALDLEPGNTIASIVLAQDEAKRGNLQGALRTLDGATVGLGDQISVSRLKLGIFSKANDHAQIEAELRKLINLYPSAITFRRELINFYLSQKRDTDAESELRVIAASTPDSTDAFMEVVRFVGLKKGPDAQQAELEERIKAGGDVLAYQLALAELRFTRGQHSVAVQDLEKLISSNLSADRRIKAQLSLASMRVRQNDYTAAVPMIAEILKADERNVEALKLRATARLEQGQPEEALADLRTALNEQPQSALLMQLLAIALERTNSVALAEKQHVDALQVSRYDANIGLQYAAFLRRQRSTAREGEILTELANRNPKNVQVWAALAEAKLRLQDWTGALQVADTVKKLEDKAGVANQIRAAAFGGQNKPNESLQALEDAFRANPNSAPLLNSLVNAYVRARKPEEAEKLLSRIIGADPNNADALVAMGSVKLSKGNKDQAESYFSQAVERQPQKGIGQSALANLYIQQNDPARAVTILRAGLKDQPDHEGLHLMLASVLINQKDYEGAILEYENLLKRRPNSLIAINNLATLLAEHQTDKASLDRAQALGSTLRTSNVPQFKDTAGWLAYLDGDYRAAVTLLEEAAAAQPSNPRIQYHLGMSYLKSGQTERAHERLRQASKLGKDDPDLLEKVRAVLKDG